MNISALTISIHISAILQIIHEKNIKVNIFLKYFVNIFEKYCFYTSKIDLITSIAAIFFGNLTAI